MAFNKKNVWINKITSGKSRVLSLKDSKLSWRPHIIKYSPDKIPEVQYIVLMLHMTVVIEIHLLLCSEGCNPEKAPPSQLT